MSYDRDKIIKYMSEIFEDIPDVVIGDIFDFISKENIKLCKHSKDENYEDEIIKVCNNLFEKLCEISDKNNDINRHDVDFDFNDDLIEGTNMSYLDACIQSISNTVNFRNNKNVCDEDKEVNLLKKPWDLINIEGKCIKNEINIFKLYLNKIFNSDRLFKVKESENKKWPPNGPGEESMIIPLRSVNLENMNKVDNLSQLKELDDEMEDIDKYINILRTDYRSILSSSSIKEYKLIKINEYRERMERMNIKKKIIKDKHYNLLFNSQNFQFIDFIINNKNDNMTIIDLHNFNRYETINVIIFCIVMILKYKLNVNFSKLFFNEGIKDGFFIKDSELLNSQRLFKGNYVDLYICVGLGNHNNKNGPRLASLVRRLSYGLNLIWRFGLKGIIILRIQDNYDWYKFIRQILNN